MKTLSYLLIITLMLTGCATYEANSLAALDPTIVHEQFDGLSVGCKEFTEDDCFTYLDRDVLEAGFQPVQLTFQNKTDQNYRFSTEGIDLPCISPMLVAEKAHTSTVKRVVGYSLGAILCPPLLISAVVDGMMSSSSNDELDEDFSQKAKRELTIAPGAFQKVVFFVPKNKYKPGFDLTLTDVANGEDKVINLKAVR